MRHCSQATTEFARRQWLPLAKPEEKERFEAEIADAERKGYRYLPACETVNAQGKCIGHTD